MKNLKNLFIPLLALALLFCCSEDNITENNENSVEIEQLSKSNDDLINQSTGAEKDKNSQNTQQNQYDSSVNRGPAPEFSPEGDLYENCFDNIDPNTPSTVVQVTYLIDIPELHKKAIRCYYADEGILINYRLCRNNPNVEFWYVTNAEPCDLIIVGVPPNSTTGGTLPEEDPEGLRVADVSCELTCQ